MPGCSSDSPEPEEPTEEIREEQPEAQPEEVTEPAPIEPIELNSLQELFVSINEDTTIDDIRASIEENGYAYHEFSFDGGYNIGYDDAAVRERDRDRVGEAVDVSFYTSGDPDLVGHIHSAEYAVHTESSTHYALKYEEGVFYYEGEPCSSGDEAMQKFLQSQKQ